jgi:4-amino-4-deoxy-L-arabinose transferase-like glycosyltransferase
MGYGIFMMNLLKRMNRKVLVLCIATFVLATAVSWGVFNAMPHLEDEQANLFQAKVFASGYVTVAEPSIAPQAFSIPFIVNKDGQLFGKYTPGYPLLLAIGTLINQPWLINSLAAMLTVLGAYLLGRDLFDQNTGLLAATLGSISPMFVMLSGTLLAHPTAMAALIFFAWMFVRARQSDEPRRLGFAIGAGASIGLALIIRPWTAIAIGTPFALLALIDLIRSRLKLLRVFVLMVIAFALIAAIYPLFNWAATGSPMTNTYQLYWPYDSIGFGPQVGRGTDGHTLEKAKINFDLDWPQFNEVIFGWPVIGAFGLSWLPIILGLVWRPFDKRAWALMIPPTTLIAAYLLYWARSGGLYGPRYYSEGLPFLWIVAAYGLIKFGSTSHKARLIKIVLIPLTLWSVFISTYPHMISGFSLYDLDRHDTNIIAAADIHHAIVFVATSYWTDYANLSWLNQPNLNTGDIIFAQNSGSDVNNLIAQQYPDRKIYYYDRTQDPPLVAAR